MATIETLKELLNQPVRTRLTKENMDKFFSLMTEEHYKAEELIIEEGNVNSNVYILREGIIRGVHNKGCYKETTLYFGQDGDYFISMHSFLENQPSFISVEACCDSIVMKISKEDIVGFARESLNFSNWALENAFGQLFAFEMKRKFITGDAYERYTSLVERRPEIIKNVSLKHIASYLGITQQSLSRLRNPKYKK